MTGFWRSWRAWAALDDRGRVAETTPAIRRLDARLRRSPPWNAAPADLLAETLWAIERDGVAPVSQAAARRGQGAGWAMRRAVARAAAMVAIALAAFVATQVCSTNPAPQGASAKPRSAGAAHGPGGSAGADAGRLTRRLERLRASMPRASLLAEARSMRQDAIDALAVLRTSMPRRPHFVDDQRSP